MPDGSNFITPEEAWAFPVEEQPIFDRLGAEIPGHVAIVRPDKDIVLGVHGSRYKMLSHTDVVSSIVDAVNDANIGGSPTVDVKVIEDGRRIRGEILFDDLVVEPQVGDYTKFRLNFFNSYDGHWSFMLMADALRLWCLNGCTTPDPAARSRFKHTQNVSTAGNAEKIVRALETFMNSPETWNHWRRIQVDDETAQSFFERTLAKSSGHIERTNNKQLENLMGLWKREKQELGPNKWGLYNAMTYWSSHTEDTKSPEMTRRRREDQLAGVLAGKLWESIA